MKFKTFAAVIGLLPFFCTAQNLETKPLFKIGTGTSRIWAPEFRNVEVASLTMPNLSDVTYTIKEFTVTVLFDQTKTYKTVKNSGDKLNTEIKNLFSSLKSNDSILIDGIAAESSGKIIYLENTYYRVR